MNVIGLWNMTIISVIVIAYIVITTGLSIWRAQARASVIYWIPVHHLCCSAVHLSAAEYPARTISLVVPYPAGSGMMTTAGPDLTEP